MGTKVGAWRRSYWSRKGIMALVQGGTVQVVRSGGILYLF